LATYNLAALESDTLLDLLDTARRHYATATERDLAKYAQFIIELELEALRRDLDCGAVPEEPAVPVERIPWPHRRFAVRRRLEALAQQSDGAAFHEALRHIHPADHAFAWSLVYAFTPDFATVGLLLRHLFFLETFVRDRDYDAAVSALFVLTHREEKPEHEILILEKALHEELGLELPANSVTAAFARWQTRVRATKGGRHA
jgi:hypothetical protein